MAVTQHPPAGFAELARVERPGGRIALFGRERPAALWVAPEGRIGPRLLAAELEHAARFGARHPEGWDYVVDTRAVRRASPLNPLWLRRIRRLPHLSRWLVVAPSPLVRLAIRAARPLVRPDAVVSSPAELDLPEA